MISAASAGNLEQINKLLNADADPNATDEAGVTPLIAASIFSHETAVELLLSRGANRSLRTKEGSVRTILQRLMGMTD
ncbi:ankyrin repeat protein [Bradyrhizobium sp. GM24.11]